MVPPKAQSRRCAAFRFCCGAQEVRLAKRNLRTLILGFGRNHPAVPFILETAPECPE
jgi:hypothetical protein